MGQLGALLYKNTALLMRQRKSLLFQAIVIVVLLFATGITNLILPGLYADTQPLSTVSYGGQEYTSSCSPPEGYPDQCMNNNKWWGLMTGPAEGDSPGSLSNATYWAGNGTGMLSNVEQYSAWVSYEVDSEYGWSYDESKYTVLPVLGEESDEDAIDSAITDAIMNRMVFPLLAAHCG